MSDEWADPPDRLNFARIARLLDRAADPRCEPVEAHKAVRAIRSMLDDHRLEFSDILHLETKSDRTMRDLIDNGRREREIDTRRIAAETRVRELEIELAARIAENGRLKKSNEGVVALRKTVDVQARQIAAAAIRPVADPPDVVTASTIQVYDLCRVLMSVSELVQATRLTEPGVRKIAARLVAMGVLTATTTRPVHFYRPAKLDETGRKFLAKMNAVRRL